MPEDNTRKQPSVALECDRRAYVRLPSDLAANCRASRRAFEPAWTGRVRDIAQGGIGLVLRHRFASGTILVVDLRDNAGAVLHSVRARVVHTTAIIDDGTPSWLIGCVFEQPLDDAKFAALR